MIVMDHIQIGYSDLYKILNMQSHMCIYMLYTNFQTIEELETDSKLIQSLSL